jgi:uncharacterized protein YggE
MTRRVVILPVVFLVVLLAAFSGAAILAAGDDNDDDRATDGVARDSALAWTAGSAPAQPAAAGEAVVVDRSAGLSMAGVAYQPAFPLTERSISVNGGGSASAPAETADLSFTIGLGEMYGPATPAPGTGGPNLSEADLQPVVDALVAAGVPADAIEVQLLPMGYYGPGGTGMVTAHITSPTVEQLDELVQVVTEAANATGRLMIYSTGARYGIADCADLQAQALENALGNARERANTIADLLAVEVGEIVYVADYGSGDPSGSNCGYPPGPYEKGYPPYESGPPFDPALPAEVSVWANLNVAFSVE